jgi:hypothetical protein
LRYIRGAKKWEVVTHGEAAEAANA